MGLPLQLVQVTLWRLELTAIPCRDTYNNIRFKEISVTAKDRKQPCVCSSVTDSVNHGVFIRSVESYAAKKGKGFLAPYILTWNDLHLKKKKKGRNKLCLICYRLCKKRLAHVCLGTESFSKVSGKLLTVSASRKMNPELGVGEALYSKPLLCLGPWEK